MKPNTHQTNCILIQTVSGHKYVVAGIIAQINRANVGMHGVLYARHNNAERRGQVARGINFLDYIAERIQHRETDSIWTKLGSHCNCRRYSTG